MSEIIEFNSSKTFESFDLAYAYLHDYLRKRNTHLVTQSKTMTDHIKYTCKCVGCFADIELAKQGNTWLFTRFNDHQCINENRGFKVTKKEIDEVIHEIDHNRSINTDISLPDLVRSKLHATIDELPDCRV